MKIKRKNTPKLHVKKPKLAKSAKAIIDKEPEVEITVESRSRALQYPFVTRNVVVLDEQWKWVAAHKYDYGCCSVSKLIRRLIKLEIASPRYDLISIVKD